MANDAWGLLDFRQALVLRKARGRWGAQAISGLVDAGETTPYQNWLCRLAAHLDAASNLLAPPADESVEASAVLQLTPEDLAPELAQEWSQWWPAEVAYFYLRARKSGIGLGGVNGLAFYLFDAPINQTRLSSLSRLSEVWLHAWAMLSGAPSKSWLPSVRTRWIITAVLLAAWNSA